MSAVAGTVSSVYGAECFLSKGKGVNYPTFLGTRQAVGAQASLLASSAQCYPGLGLLLYHIPSKEKLQHSQPLTSCPLVGFHFCKAAQLATSIHLFKTDTPIDSISSINPEVFCKHKVGLCSNLTKQLRRQSDCFQ